MSGKKLPFPGKRRDGLTKSQLDQPERSSSGELRRGRREDHTQRRFVPVAMEMALQTFPRKAPKLKRISKSGGRDRRRSPSTLLLNRSNVKRKSNARGRARL